MPRDDADRLVTAAVADNEAWCEAVCRSLNRPTIRTPTLWGAADPPRWYPHRISLASQLAAPDAVAGLRDDADCWVKDSFSSLELGEHGFTPVVHASWIHRVPQSPVAVGGWSLVASAAELHDWAVASGTLGVVTASLLGCPQVKFLSVREGGAVVAGAVLTCGTDVVGLSNVYSDGQTPEETWGVVTAAATHLFPGRDLVGYEDGEGLEAAVRAGFSQVGELRLWHRLARSAESLT